MKLFKNKLFLMLFATLFAICLFNSKCFASVDIPVHDATLGDITIRLSDEQASYNSIVFLTVDSYLALSHDNYHFCKSFHLYLSNGDIALNQIFEDNGATYATSSLILYRGATFENDIVDFTSSVSDDLKLVYVNEDYNIKNVFKYGAGNTFLSEGFNLDYATRDVYLFDSKTDELTTILFQVASQPVEETNQVVLAEIVEPMEMDKTLAEILGILPIVIVVIVSLIAIRKAIVFLVTLLHRS